MSEFSKWAKVRDLPGPTAPPIPPSGQSAPPPSDQSPLLDPATAIHYLYQSNVALAKRIDALIELLSEKPVRQEQREGIVTQSIQREQLVPYSFIREQYYIVERAHLTLTAKPTYYDVLDEGAALALLITDSIIAFDTRQITADSPQMSGSTTTYATIVLGIQRIIPPPGQKKRIHAQLVSGTGNLWIVLAD